METVTINQARQGSLSQETGGSGNVPPVVLLVLVAPVALVVYSNNWAQLLKDFMAFRPPEFHGGTDTATAENWILAIEKHHRSIGVNHHESSCFSFTSRASELLMMIIASLALSITTIGRPPEDHI